MSMSISRAKYTGDPGLGSFFKGVAKVGLGLASMLPGVGGIARTLSSAIFPPAPGTTTYAQSPAMTMMPRTPQAGPGGISASVATFQQQCSAEGVPDWYACGIQRSQGVFGQRGSGMVMNGQIPKPGIIAAIQRYYPGGATGMTDPVFDVAAGQAGKACPVSGYHWNKSGYFLKSGEYVSAGTKMVKNRRRNPANPRATSNAITRIKGAKRYAKSLSSISIRKSC